MHFAKRICLLLPSFWNRYWFTFLEFNWRFICHWIMKNKDTLKIIWTFTDQRFSRPISASFTDSRKNMTNESQVSLTQIFSQWLHLKFLTWFYKRGKWSVKLAINLSYFCNHFCKTNCNRRSRKYFVSVTRVTQIIWLNLMDAYKFWRYTLIFLFKLPTQI